MFLGPGRKAIAVLYRFDQHFFRSFFGFTFDTFRSSRISTGGDHITFQVNIFVRRQRAQDVRFAGSEQAMREREKV